MRSYLRQRTERSIGLDGGSRGAQGLQQLIAGQRFGAASDQISSNYEIGVYAQ
ncbi:MAG: hypothetical protein ABIP93_07810 [Gemmatimonadaceae bacterium]